MIKLTFYSMLLASVLYLFPSCDKQSAFSTGEDGRAFLIDSEHLYGTYEVTEGSLSVLGLTTGRLLTIREGQLEVQCDNTFAYSRSYNTLSVDGRPLLVTAKTEGVEYQISYTTPTSRSYINLIKTDKTCTDGEGGEEEPNEEPGGPVIGKIELDKLYGYGVGTTGGEGASPANIHHFDDGDKFKAWLNAREKAKSKVPAVVWLSGTFTKDNGRAPNSPWFDVKDTDNITIFGTNSFRMQNIGFFIVRSNNIIVRNVHVVMPKADNGADGISMQNSSQIWIDHCTFESVNQASDYEDGACDITHGTTNVTISWNHFIKTQKTSLVGHSNSATGDAAIKATYHHNFFDRTSSRHPRVRFGQVHVFNNFFNAASTYGVGAAYEAKVLVEGNYFDGVHLPTDICTFPAKRSGGSWVSNLTGSVAGYLYASANEYVNKPSNSSDPYPFTNVEYKAYGGEKLSVPLTREDFLPPYGYEIDDPAKVKEIVIAGAGVGKLPNYDSAPVPVDNGGIPDGGDNGDDDDTGGGNGPIELGNGWLALSIGNSQLTAAANGNSITITGAGKFESGRQEFSYVYREVEGDFTAIVRLDDYQTPGTSNQSLAGIFVTPDPTAADDKLLHAMVAKGGTGNYHHSRRLSEGTASKGSFSVSGSKVPLLRLERNGNDLIRSVSLDGGNTFSSNRSDVIPNLPGKIYIGLAVSSGGNTPATAVFSDFKINGVMFGF